MSRCLPAIRRWCQGWRHVHGPDRAGGRIGTVLLPLPLPLPLLRGQSVVLDGASADKTVQMRVRTGAEFQLIFVVVIEE